MLTKNLYQQLREQLKNLWAVGNGNSSPEHRSGGAEKPIQAAINTKPLIATSIFVSYTRSAIDDMRTAIECGTATRLRMGSGVGRGSLLYQHVRNGN